MTSSTRLRARAVLSSLSLLLACSTGKPPDPDDTSVGGTSVGGSTTGGVSGTAGTAATGQGGSAAIGQGGASATGGVSTVGGAGGSSATAGTDPGTGGSTGGVSAASGMGGTGGGTSGDAGMAAVGGGGTAGSAGMSGSGGTDPGICQHLSVIATPQVPTVELLVDTSSSMWETMPPAWPVLYAALMDPAAGAVAALQDKMRFGFASYKGFLGTSETDMACATMTTVPPELDNHDAIDAAYKAIGDGYKQGDKWETPTNYAITYAAKILGDYDPMPPGPKYILLVTDGNPNTCQTTDPQCGQDYAIKAAQDAFTAGVGLFILGIGDIVTSPNNGCPTSARCGMNHLQDMANAGVGAGVMPPTGCDDPADPGCQLKYEACNKGNMLTATYTPAAPAVGTPFSVDTSATGAQAALTTKLSTLLSNAVSCTFEMDAIVTGDASLGIVTLNSAPVTYNTADGWILEMDAYHVTLQGAACDAYKAGGMLSIDFPCDPSGNPVAVHR